MSIYSKKVLGVIFVVTLIISTVFYFVNKEDTVDKDKLYENKLASQNHKSADKKYGVSTNNKIAREVGNKILEDGGNSAAVSYTHLTLPTTPYV